MDGMFCEQPSYITWPSRARRLSLGLLVASLLVAATAVGCGESDADKAQTQVCDARADLNTQVDKLASLTATTATVDAVSGALDAIKNDLEQIADAQGDLNDERKQEVESANQQFSAQLEAVASGLGSNLSVSGAKARWRVRARSWRVPTSRPSPRSTATELGRERCSVERRHRARDGVVARHRDAVRPLRRRARAAGQRACEAARKRRRARP